MRAIQALILKNLFIIKDPKSQGFEIDLAHPYFLAKTRARINRPGRDPDCPGGSQQIMPISI